MAPIVAGSSLPASPPTSYPGIIGGATKYLAAYTIDDAVTPGTFSQSTTSFSGTQQGTSIHDSGSLTVLARGLRSLATTYAYNPNYGKSMAYSPAQTGSYAVELAGQSGGVVQLLGQAATPIVATSSCPSYATAQTFQFITLPAAVISTTPESDTWNPATQTAFGSVSVVSSGTDFTFNSIQQFTLPVNGAAPGKLTANATSPTGACSSTPYGYVISSPADVVITNPGDSQSATPAAAIGIGPTGLLVENNGNNGTKQSTSYFLGAGTGAIGVPQPTSPLTTSDVVGKQYLGFVYGSGVYNGSGPTGWSSTLASFGFATQPSTCASVVPSTPTLIYGGDFPSKNPADPNVQTNGGYGNCNLAIDLGTQSSTSNGLYPSATVTMTTGFSANTTNKTNTFSAVAVVGQLQGKYVILLIGKDATQAWSMYLMQSN
jgi:hypothetical protein